MSKEKDNYINELVSKTGLTLEDCIKRQIPSNIINVLVKNQRNMWDYHYCPSCYSGTLTETGDPYVDYDLDYCQCCGQKLSYDKPINIIIDKDKLIGSIDNHEVAIEYGYDGSTMDIPIVCKQLRDKLLKCFNGKEGDYE